jgi:hypothetical protein
MRVATLGGRAVTVPSRNGQVASLDDGTPVLQRGAGGIWEPLPATVEREGLLLVINDGRELSAIRYPDIDGAAQVRWVAPAHRREELDRRMRELNLEADKLPPQIASRVRPMLALIGLVSATEGDFADPATHPDDRAASLGIFQWAAERDTLHAAGSSLSRFFVALKRRATANEDPLYVRAWKQCTRRGFDIRAGELRLAKKRATPAQVVSRLRETFGEGALRTYQLVAAFDWIDEIRSTVIRPGFRGGSLLGHGYAEAEAGKMVRFDIGGRAVRMRAAAVTTVGEVLRAPAALATAVSLGVNRPHYVESALWQTLAPADAQERVAQALEGGRLDEVRTVIWPAANGVDERTLLSGFRARAIELYRPADRERRARRLATALLLDDR